MTRVVVFLSVSVAPIKEGARRYEDEYLALSQSKNFSKLTILTKHRSHASRIPSSNQSSSCHLAERKTPLSTCPSSKTCPEMGLRTVFTVQKPKKATPINAYSTEMSID
ncbi:uncharacterized protein TNCV_1269461 [Trichonephila clavipes]|nr:uncharacterized protein TNCV_1269461 [Trichonephila clavipes]